MTVGVEEPFDGVWLRLSATEPGTCRISAEAVAVESGLCTPANRYLSPALVEADSLAYFTQRRLPDDVSSVPRWELGAIGHGPTGLELADWLTTHIHAWGRHRGAQPVITAYPATTPDHALAPGRVIDKPHIRLVIRY